MADSEGNRQLSMPREDRVKVCQHIMGKLGSYYRSVPEAALKEKTSAFESQVFSRATSRHDYLEKIAEGLSKVENQVQQSAQLAAVAQQQQQQQVGGAAGVQAQAVLRQQLQQQHAHQQASIRQRQLMHHQMQQQQQQYHLQAQQMMLQRQQQAQQAQQQNVQAGIPKQDTGRKSATTKRQPGGVDGKAKTSGATKSSNSASTAGLGGRGKTQTLSHGSSANSEMFSRKSQGQIGSKPGAFPTAPGNMNGGVASNDYLMAFARQQQGQQGNNSQQAQTSAHGGTAADGMGHGSQHGHQVSSGQISNVPSGQQTSQHTQQQQRVGQDPHAILSHQSLRQSQGLTNQSMNVAGNAALSGVIMDTTNGSSNVENRRAVAMATIAATAAAAGMEFTAEQARNLTPEQVRQILAMATQRNGSGNFNGNGGNQNVGMPSTSAAPNMSSWLGQFANSGVGRGGAGQGQPAGQNHALSQALAFEKQKQLQHSRHQQLQSGSVQAGATPAPGKRGGQNAVASASAAGVTVPQMNAILAKESAKIEKFAGTAQEKQAALVEALQASNRARSSQGRQSTSQEHVPVGALSGGASGASAGMASGHGSHMSRTAGETEFWAKLQDMQAKYKASLKRLFPIIQRYQDRQPEKNKEAFMKHLRDCFNILNLQRPAPIPARLTTVVLERAERFIAQVVTVYSRHLREMVENTNANPERRRQMAAQRDARGVIPNSVQLGAGTSSQPGSRAPASVLPQQGKAEQTLQQGVPPHLDAQQQQQYARFQQQQAQLQKQQKTQSLKQTQLQLHQQQQQQKQQSLQQGATLPQPMQGTQVSPAQGVTSQDQGSHGAPQSSQPPSFHSHQKNSHNQLSQGSAADNAKSQGKGTVAKGSGRRGGITRGGRGGTQLGAPRGSVTGAMQSHSQVQARTQAQVQAQVHAQVQAQAQAQAAAAAQAHAQVQAAAQAQATQAQAVEAQAHVQVQAQQAHAQVQAQSQRLQQQMRAEQNVHVQRAQHSRIQRSSLMRQQAQQSRLRGQSPVDGNKQQPGTQIAGGWAGSYPAQAGLMGIVPNGAPTGERAKRPELTPQQRVQMLEATVKDALENAHRLETYVDGEMKRAKSERIQNTLAALRNNASVKAAIMGNKKGTKRQASLVDVDNFGDKSGVIKSKTVFECSSEAGLRLAKKPKNEAQDLKSLREAVEADCRAAEERNPLLLIEIIEEFGQPVVTCLLKITEIKLPKLVLRVQQGYPRKGGATFGFERPPMGWVGVLDEIRSRFRRALTTMPAASVGVAAFLDAWAREADAVINGSHLSENR